MSANPILAVSTGECKLVPHANTARSQVAGYGLTATEPSSRGGISIQVLPGASRIAMPKYHAAVGVVVSIHLSLSIAPWAPSPSRAEVPVSDMF